MEQYLQILLSQHTFKVKNHRNHNCHHYSAKAGTREEKLRRDFSSSGIFLYGSQTARKHQGQIMNRVSQNLILSSAHILIGKRLNRQEAEKEALLPTDVGRTIFIIRVSLLLRTFCPHSLRKAKPRDSPHFLHPSLCAQNVVWPSKWLQHNRMHVKSYKTTVVLTAIKIALIIQLRTVEFIRFREALATNPHSP